MASNLPLPLPPRTPTPPADDEHAPQINSGILIDRNSLSPLKASFPKGIMNDESRDTLSPTKSSFNPSFNLATSPEYAETPIENGSGEPSPAEPFNFNTTVMAKSPVIKSVS